MAGISESKAFQQARLKYEEEEYARYLQQIAQRNADYLGQAGEMRHKEEHARYLQEKARQSAGFGLGLGLAGQAIGVPLQQKADLAAHGTYNFREIGVNKVLLLCK